MRVVLITGASSGFGLEASLAFARKGDRVFATMRDTSRSHTLLQAAQAEGLQLEVLPLDVTEPSSFPAFVENLAAETGQLDVLVNNAGILCAGALEDVSEERLRLVMETNFFGPVLLTRAVLPRMRQQGSGHVIMISSLSGIAGLPGDAPYSASKYALEGITEALRHEVDRWGIRVSLVEAGMYATKIVDSCVPADALLPQDYPQNSPYRPLVENRLAAMKERLPDAFHPRVVGELVERIASSTEDRLRWPADEVAERVLATLFAQDDPGRDEFLRQVAGTEWWSSGKDAP